MNNFWNWAKQVEWLNEGRTQLLGITLGIIFLWWVTNSGR